MSTSQLIRDIVAPQIEETIKGSGLLGDYVYDVSLSLVMPGQQGITIQPNLQITIAEKHPVNIGGWLTMMTSIPGPFPEPGHVDTAVLGLLNGLSDARKEALEQKPSGLITP